MEYVDNSVDECIQQHGSDIIILSLLGDFLSHFLSNISLKWNWDKYYGWVSGEGGESISFTIYIYIYRTILFRTQFLKIAILYDIDGEDQGPHL